MLNWLRRWLMPAQAAQHSPLWQTLWPATLAHYPFLSALPPSDQERLQQLAAHFVTDKEFTGANGLVVTDAMALAVAAQACLPLLHLLPADTPVRELLGWYDDFVGIVLHPGGVLATRRLQDEDGVIHQWREALSGEAMPGGPVMLSWADVDQADRTMRQGYNVVIHEFAHKLDLRHGPADGYPSLPSGFAPQLSPSAARMHWQTRITAEFEAFCEQVAAHTRFGQPPAPWLNDYAATSLAEFFAVASEAYFVNPQGLIGQSAGLHRLLDAYYQAGKRIDMRAPPDDGPPGLTSQSGCPLP